MGALPRFRAAHSLPGPLRALILLALVMLTAVGLVAMHSALSESPVAASSASGHDHAHLTHDSAPADAPEHHEALVMGCVLGMLLLTILFVLAIARQPRPLAVLARALAATWIAVLPRPPRPSLDLLCISRT
ncbi:MAG: hypothetical protein WA006_01590 [Rhodoglobus sp.]